MNIINYYIGAQVANRRQEKKITQSQLAEEININRTVISSLEAGKYATRMPTLYKICKVLDCTITDLMPSVDFYFKNKDKKLIRKVVFQFEEEQDND